MRFHELAQGSGVNGATRTIGRPSGDAWITEFPGRSVLAADANAHLTGVSYEAFRGVLVDKMSTAGFQPAGMKMLIDQIEAA